MKKISDKFLFSHESDKEAIEEVLNQHKLSGTAEIVEQYEEKLIQFFDSKYAVALSSGTAALEASLYAVGVRAQDEVIISSVCPVMSAMPILSLGAKPVFCDTDKDSFSLNLEDLKDKISSKTKAVIEVPMWGYPTKVSRLSQFLQIKQIPFILDLAQAHGTKVEDKYLSYYSDIACFSTHDKKILATGEGGFSLTDNLDYYNFIKEYLNFGGMTGDKFGLNFKLGAMQAALGKSRIDFINSQIETRRNNASYIKSGLNSDKLEELKLEDQEKPNYYSLVLKINSSNPQNLIERLEDQGIPSDIKKYNFKPLYNFPVFENYKSLCKNSEELVSSITTIPTHPGLNKEDLDYIIETINKL